MFELFMDGQLKYFHGADQKGTINLTLNSQARKISKTELEISLPENRKNYLLL